MNSIELKQALTQGKDANPTPDDLASEVAARQQLSEEFRKLVTSAVSVVEVESAEAESPELTEDEIESINESLLKMRASDIKQVANSIERVRSKLIEKDPQSED